VVAVIVVGEGKDRRRAFMVVVARPRLGEGKSLKEGSQPVSWEPGRDLFCTASEGISRRGPEKWSSTAWKPQTGQKRVKGDAKLVTLSWPILDLAPGGDLQMRVSAGLVEGE
jgi:hypothetical protein